MKKNNCAEGGGAWSCQIDLEDSLYIKEMMTALNEPIGK